MKYSFIYDPAIADKLDRKKLDGIKQNSEGFSTVSDEIDLRKTGEKYRFAAETCTGCGLTENP